MAELSGNADRGTLEQLVQDAVVASPVYGLLDSELPSFFTLVHNGRAIKSARALALEAVALGEPTGQFEQAVPAAGDWSGLVRRAGLTPKTEESVTLAGDSLADEQNRILHLRGICTLRADGVKQVEVQLFNPHGSIFHLRSDESVSQGGQGRAPDALSYVAAGIGFCFMTQLGRYAKIGKLKLHRYSIVQDLHFSHGGASGSHGKPGAAAPVETHVHLDSDESDDTARLMLDMAEQTCFLHALCKARLRTHIQVVVR